MRPRHKAAENVNFGNFEVDLESASMRPRHKAAENVRLTPTEPGAVPASMRPRHKAAENREVSKINDPNGQSFNEAAA